MKPLLRALLIGVLAMCASAVRAADPPPALVVFGAASLTNVLQDIGAEYQRKTAREVSFSFAASSVLARQIEAGTRADVFFSADEDWADYLQARKLIEPSSRHDIVKNRLVLIAPASSDIKLKIAPHFALAAALGDGRLATGDPASVPVGRCPHQARRVGRGFIAHRPCGGCALGARLRRTRRDGARHCLPNRCADREARAHRRHLCGRLASANYLPGRARGNCKARCT